MKYQITLTEKQARLLSYALDQFPRLIQGQDWSFQELMESAWEKRCKKATGDMMDKEWEGGWAAMREDAERICKEIKKRFWGLEWNANYGIHYDDTADAEKASNTPTPTKQIHISQDPHSASATTARQSKDSTTSSSLSTKSDASEGSKGNSPFSDRQNPHHTALQGRFSIIFWNFGHFFATLFCFLGVFGDQLPKIANSSKYFFVILPFANPKMGIKSPSDPLPSPPSPHITPNLPHSSLLS